MPVVELGGPGRARSWPPACSSSLVMATFSLIGLVLGLVAGHDLEGARCHRDVLRADAEEAADADHPKASILPSLSNRMSVTSPIFRSSAPIGIGALELRARRN